MQESGHLAARRLTGRVGSPQRPSPPEALLFLLLIHHPLAESPTQQNNHTNTRVTPPHVHTTDSVSLPPRTEKCSLLTRTPGSSGPQCPEPDPDPGPARTGHEGAVPCKTSARRRAISSPRRASSARCSRNTWNATSSSMVHTLLIQAHKCCCGLKAQCANASASLQRSIYRIVCLRRIILSMEAIL